MIHSRAGYHRLEAGIWLYRRQLEVDGRRLSVLGHDELWDGLGFAQDQRTLVPQCRIFEGCWLDGWSVSFAPLFFENVLEFMHSHVGKDLPR